MEIFSDYEENREDLVKWRKERPRVQLIHQDVPMFIET